ncbi:Uncharacterized protein DB42_BB00090 [Neochlamydia sp. EPS4]|nr:Uncharacterized protein DB42_BB00090 [Neochlamydia sp. EPS4]
MMTSFNSEVSRTKALNAVKSEDSKETTEMELEQLVFLLLTERLNQLQQKSNDEFQELKKRQEEVVQMHKVLKLINSQTTDRSELSFDTSHDLTHHLKDAREKLGIDIQEGSIKNGKMIYTKDQRDRLIDNIRMTIDDYNTKNDMQMQTVNRLINERYESYQMARAILKPIHDDKMSKARAIMGR